MKKKKPVEVKFIDSIEEVTMDKVIMCTCDAKYSVLVLSGNPTEEEQAMAWLSLKSQYLERIGGGESSMQIEMMQEVTEYDWKRTEIEALISLLQEEYDSDIAGMLRDMYDFEYPITEETYLSDIVKIMAELGSEKLDIDAIRVQLYGNVEKAKDATKEAYYNTILLLQKHLGLCHGMTPMLVCKQLTWYEFGTYLNEYNRMKPSKKVVEDVESE